MSNSPVGWALAHRDQHKSHGGLKPTLPIAEQQASAQALVNCSRSSWAKAAAGSAGLTR